MLLDDTLTPDCHILHNFGLSIWIWYKPLHVVWQCWPNNWLFQMFWCHPDYSRRQLPLPFGNMYWWTNGISLNLLYPITKIKNMKFLWHSYDILICWKGKGSLVRRFTSPKITLNPNPNHWLIFSQVHALTLPKSSDYWTFGLVNLRTSEPFPLKRCYFSHDLAPLMVSQMSPRMEILLMFQKPKF